MSWLDDVMAKIFPPKEDQPKAPPPESKPSKSPPWFVFAKKFSGKKETDPELQRALVPAWRRLFGSDIRTIVGNKAAWCGLAMAVALSSAGVEYAKNGYLAKNWGKYAVEIDWKHDGIPQGAIVRLNHARDCKSSSNNHVSQANGDCAAEDLSKPNAMIDLYGGNQSNTWKVSTYSVKEICEVRWPPRYPKPQRVLKSVNCSGKKTSDETTR